jgi:hypothetical protein
MFLNMYVVHYYRTWYGIYQTIYHVGSHTNCKPTLGESFDEDQNTDDCVN